MNLFEKGSYARLYRLKASLVLISVLSFCSAVGLTAFNRTYLAQNGLYKNGAALIIPVLLAFFAVGSCIFGALSVESSDNVSDLPSARRTPLTVVSFVLGAELVSIFIIYMLLGPLDIQYGVGKGILNTPDLAEKMKTALLCYRLMVPLSLFAPIYFVIAAMKNKIDAFFGSITLVWVLLYIMRLYFDVTDWVMSVRKLSVICAMCIFAIFLIHEIRFAFGRGDLRKYFFFSSLSSVFCISCGFAGVCSVFIKVYPLNYELPYYGALLFMGVYAFIRTLAFLPGKRSHSEIYDAYASEEENESEDAAK